MNVNDYFNRTVVSTDGSKIGSVDNVFVDEGTDSPEWITVKTGMFGSHESFVPIAGSAVVGGDVQVPFSKDQVKDAPHFETDQNLTEADEAALYSHYQMQRGAASSAGSSLEDHSGHDHAMREGHDVSGPNTDDAMTRSEERLHVGTETVQTGTARLRKYIVTENVTQTVPVSHEEVRIEREPITDANRDQALAGKDLSEEEHEVTLTEDRIVTTKETVPVERVRLSTETVTGEQQVDETVRKEQIDTVYPDGVDVTDRERADRR
jgi:uncharacterized protein (TIGR02271 family)